MTIYLDLIFLLNLFLDFLLLLTVSILLKRNAKIIRVFIGSFIGALSIFTLFIKINSLELFFIKFFISIFMILISFGYKNIKYTFDNIIYLYLVSVILGGVLYMINDSIAYKSIGLIFFHNGFSINILIIIILSPIILFLYLKQSAKLKEEYSKRYEVNITFLNKKKLNLTGFLDTGNNLYDPYKKRPIILINKELLNGYNPRYILVPIMTVKDNSLLKCFKIKEIVVNGKKIEDEVLVGISDNNFKIEGVDLLLHKQIVKETI